MYIMLCVCKWEHVVLNLIKLDTMAFKRNLTTSVGTSLLLVLLGTEFVTTHLDQILRGLPTVGSHVRTTLGIIGVVL